MQNYNSNEELLLDSSSFISYFLPNTSYSCYLPTFPNLSNFESSGLYEIQNQFIERIQLNSNFNIFIYSHFQESGVGKSSVALFIAEKLQEISNFNFHFIPDFESFLIDSNIENKSIYLIDDSSVSEIGLGSKRIKEHFNEFLGISARHSQICFIFTTTLDLRKFDFLVNIHRLVSVIGINKELELSLSYTYQKHRTESTYFLSRLPSQELLEKYLIMKNQYVDSFKNHRQGNKTVSSIVANIEISDINDYSKTELEALLSSKYNLTNTEINRIVTLLSLKRKLRLTKKYYNDTDYQNNKNVIDKNREF